MANDRMFLVHKPTGRAVMLGKHMTLDWYLPHPEETGRDLEAMFSDLGPNKDFVLAYESDDGFQYIDSAEGLRIKV